MPLKIKICGIMSERDAAVAVECGADAVGFDFHRSAVRKITPVEARKIVKRLPPFVQAVGIFENDRRDWIERVIEEVGLAAVQLKGREAPQLCSMLRVPVIKQITLGSKGDIEYAGNYDAAAYLLTATNGNGSPESSRGSRMELITLAGQSLGRVVLSGDSVAGYMAEAVRIVKPYGVDASFCVEDENGHKSPEKIEKFIKEVKHACI